MKKKFLLTFTCIFLSVCVMSCAKKAKCEKCGKEAPLTAVTFEDKSLNLCKNCASEIKETVSAVKEAEQSSSDALQAALNDENK